MRFIPVKILVIHPASAGEEHKESMSSGIEIFHQEKGGRL
ncbi:hypothetical protein Tco_0219391, partial [Tanacetum coccineum]